ncbi:hypothetical protein [Leptothermofonsia sp. ETS-13]|uniref:hypothetical protein n=1 Tax=Leptothermofonsia sp. ETS-13 TaxID=3035696 RepID=UPI003B9FBF4E
MLPPLYMCPLSETQQAALEQGLRCKDAFTLRRCQILLARARRIQPRDIATTVGGSVQNCLQGDSCLRAAGVSLFARLIELS